MCTNPPPRSSPATNITHGCFINGFIRSLLKEKPGLLRITETPAQSINHTRQLEQFEFFIRERSFGVITATAEVVAGVISVVDAVVVVIRVISVRDSVTIVVIVLRAA